MKVRFTGITEITRFAGVFRAPNETANLRAEHAREAIRCGLAVPVGHVAMARPTRHAAMENPLAMESQRPDFTQVRESALNLAQICAYRDTVVIVPCFRSRAHVGALLAGMGLERSAVLLVPDGDGVYPEHAAQVVLSANSGFAHACNTGVRHTCSKYICFLNADIRVTPGWLDAMIAEIERDARIAAVGNRQLDAAGRIHSCGSAWSWRTGRFEHFLRGRQPARQREWTVPRDLDAITGSCLLVRRDAFERVGGFDENYRQGYWEDSDLCMKLRHSGYRIRFTPDSQITHFTGHSGENDHAWYQRNADLCRARWVESGLVDKFAKQRGEKIHRGDVVACMIALNEAEYIAPSIESVYPLADRIIVVEGGNDYAVKAGWCGPDKRSTDGTIEAVKGVADTQNKIELITGAWRDKAAQRNAYASRLDPGDIMLLLDADEVFYDAGLWRLSYLMHQHPVIMPGFDLFWNDFRTVGTGRWADYPQVKAVRWEVGYHYRDHNCPCDGQGRVITSIHKPYRTKERLYAHYAWVKPLEKLRAKAAYYERQPGAAQQMRRDYIDKVFLPWRENPKEIETRYGTHPFGRGETEQFIGRHPEPMQERLPGCSCDWGTRVAG